MRSGKKRFYIMAYVVITGGSRGIGAAAVRAFAQRGDTVSFLYETHHQQANALAAQTGATAICADVGDAAAVKAAFSRIPQVDILINNAGISVTGLISQTDEADWLRLFNVNVHGMYRCINAALPSFLQKQAGCIINVSSMWGQVGASCEVGYSATKGAVLAMTKALAKELGPSHIRVNAIAPGVICTDMVANLSPDTMDMLREETPLGVLGTPEQVAQAMIYLADAQFVTGQVLGVNGGFVI